MDCHGNIPRHFLSQVDGSLVQIDTEFHDYSMSFIQVLFSFILEHDMDFGIMEFPWHLLKNDGISIGFGVVDQTKLPRRRHRVSHFLLGSY